MARRFQIDTPAQIGGLLEALGGLTVTGNLILGNQGTATTHAVRADRSISAGTGLSGGGNLTANRTLSFDTTWGDARYALVGHNHDSVYAPLSHVGSGGSAHAVATTTTAGFFDPADKVKLNEIEAKAINKATADGLYALRTISISAGTGLTGGGNLTATRSLAIDTTWLNTTGDARWLKLDGTNTVTGSVNFTAPTFLISKYATRKSWMFYHPNSNDFILAPSTAVDGVTLDATKQFLFTDGGNFEAKGELKGATLSLSGNAVIGGTISEGGTLLSSKYASTGTSISAGTGLTGGGTLAATRTLSVNFAGSGSAGTVARSDHSHSLGNMTDVTLTSPAAGHFLRHNGTAWVNTLPQLSDNSDVTLTTPANGQVLFRNATGWVNATLATAGIASTGTSISAGTGLTGGGTLAATRTLSVDFTTSGGDNGTDTKVARGNHLHDGRYLQLTGGTLSGSLTLTSGILTAPRVNTDGFQIYHDGATSRINSVGVGDVHFGYQQNGIRWRFGASSTGSSLEIAGDLIGTAIFENGTALSSKYALQTTSLSAGTGLTGGGTLAATRTLSFDTTWGDGRYALSSRTITAGTGLSGGGSLAANRTLSFDTAWGDARYSLSTHNHDSAYVSKSGDTMSGAYTITGLLTLNTAGTGTTHAVRGDRTISTGTGLTGGGNLTANRTLSFDTTWGDARYALSGHNHDTVYAPISHVGSGGAAHANATTTVDGFMSAADKVRLNNMQDSAINKATADGLYALRTITLTGGTGIVTTIGNLTANRTISFDTTWGDGRYATKSGDNTLTGNLTINGIIKTSKSTWSVTFAAGEVSKTITHSFGTTNYMVALGANSVARHVAWESKATNTVNIVLDSAYTEAITVDVIILGY